MTNTNKRNLIIVAVVLSIALVLAVCVSVFFPKTTIADLLHLTSKDQIESITLRSYYVYFHPSGWGKSNASGQYDTTSDITGTPLAEQYIEAFFNASVSFQEESCLKEKGEIEGKYLGRSRYRTASLIYITVHNVPEEYPVVEREFILICNNDLAYSDFPEIKLSYRYTTDYIHEQFKENSAQGNHEQIKESESYLFNVPGEKLFTTAFIKEQLGINE